MTTVAAPERQFLVFERGELREDILTSFRNGLRLLVNPETGAAFTELEIAVATAKLSRWYNEADSIDLTQQAVQYRGLFLADQIPIDTASTAYLEGLHGKEWGEAKLGASGGSGPCTAPAAIGTVFVGSTIVPDPAATYGTAPDGKRFQVLFNVTTPASGIAGSEVAFPLVLVGVDTGEETNLNVGDKITWSNAAPGATGPATVTLKFTGGTEAETDADFAKRLLSRIRHKPASGNNAHFRGWAREASNAVEDACVYACAFHAGSVLVAVIQKRANVQGPTGRIASIGTLASVTNYVTPPGSPVVPNPPHVVPTACTGTPSNMVMSLSLPKGRSSGWEDLQPWPQQASGVAATITALATQVSFTLTRPAGSPDLPSGVTAPKLMVWNEAISRFEKLEVVSVVTAGGLTYTVTLAAPPSFTIATGMYISPYAQRLSVIGETIEDYFDALGPGEVVDLATDNRAHRAYRFPEPNEELPQRAGSSVLTFLSDALGGTLADSTLNSVSLTDPALPADVVNGPNLIVAGKVGIYAF